MKVRRVAIVGGGIGGLAAAFFLHGRTTPAGDERFECTLFEKSADLGGNAHSAYGRVALAPPFGDLGVNDINRDTYALMNALLQTLDDTVIAGAHPFTVPMASLLDTTCWYTPADQAGPPVSYTGDDLAHPTTPFLESIARDWHHFATDGARRVLENPGRYGEMSVADFVAEQAYSEAFARYNLYPRINGMYFMDQVRPEEMPISGVMSYYHLQEGMGGETPPTPRRQYFVNGASDWIDKLAGYVRYRGVTIHTEVAVSIDASRASGPAVTWHAEDGGGGKEAFDAAILGVPANEVGRIVTRGLPDSMAPVLAAFRYFPSLALWHDDDSVMPPERAHWRTYNIVIHPRERYLLRPYTINYVCAMHQGRDVAEAPFVSESPHGGVLRDRVRERLPRAVTGPREPAVARFPHNLVSIASMRAQRDLVSRQGLQGLYYTGGWTNGAGLHEEIIAVSLDISRMLRQCFVDSEANVRLPQRPDQVPHYLRRSLSGAAEAEALYPEGFLAP